ncbi:heterokaryon incompatibility protein-domain-containing protein, partial [Phaeosphaeriaceae sp. PMI808]
MSHATFRYHYKKLLPEPSIRLLRLLPSEDENADIQCQLFNCSLLQQSGKRAHPYDALSYVWGRLDKTSPTPPTPTIRIDQLNLPVTLNLHEALTRLRHCHIERIVWVDAVCINQEDRIEKEQQIGFMAKIYGQAHRVVVWLGKAADNSDEALEEIRVAAGQTSTIFSNNEKMQHAILALLQRPWFRRIWILQEVAAARHILVICGPTEIDGYAFCLGVDSLMEFYKVPRDLQGSIRSVTYLIRGAIFRPNYIASGPGKVSQDVCSLGELIDMYHTHKATLRHDKVYALLGMSSDDDNKAPSPDYKVVWKDLFEKLARFLLCEGISVEASGDKEIAVIKSKGCILGKVSSVRSDIAWNSGQGVDVVLKNISKQLGYEGKWSAHWNLQSSAKPIQDGDLICLIQESSKPTIIRLCKDYFTIIMIAATPIESTQTWSEDIKWPKLWQSVKVFPRNFLLVWDWENSPGKLQVLREYEEPEGYLDEATRLWNLALVLGDAGVYEKAEEK